MGLFKSICPVCGKEYPNSMMATCGGRERGLKVSCYRMKPGCGGRYCINCYIQTSFLEKGIFKDKYVQHYHCPNPKCGYDNGLYLEKVTVWRFFDRPYRPDTRIFHNDGRYY
ncbi:MAG: hypothetical protein NT178_16680 [Proteobacteria bacterium]|nr:hypothetical protein [Pseudomonadota bacterium]